MSIPEIYGSGVETDGRDRTWFRERLNTFKGVGKWTGITFPLLNEGSAARIEEDDR